MLRNVGSLATSVRAIDEESALECCHWLGVLDHNKVIVLTLATRRGTGRGFNEIISREFIPT
jgi:hypothetical protein